MAVSSTSGTTRTVSEIVTAAFHLAGLEYSGHEPDADDARLGRTLLDTMIDALQARGVTARRATFTEITTVAGTQAYALDESILDVVRDGTYKESSTGTSEITVFQIGADQWRKIPAKTAQGRPTMMWVNRGAQPIEVNFWPIPSVSNAIITVRAHTSAGDSDVSASTIDLDTYWYQWAIWELAHQLATAKLMEPRHINHLAEMAVTKLDEALRYARQHTGTTMQVGHKTAWS